MTHRLFSEPASKQRILANLHLAIDEVKLLRSLTMSKELARNLQHKSPQSDRLQFVQKEIGYLESELANVLRKAAYE